MIESKLIVVGLGEALFDVFASGKKLGGAPLNVAAHAHQLLASVGGCGAVVTRVAHDELGVELMQQVRSLGLDTSYIQQNADAPTGRVEVQQHEDGGHTFHIERPSAWDEIEFTRQAEQLAHQCDAVAFGSLAQRSTTSRSSIRSFLAAAPQAIKLFDVNLRSSRGHDFFDGPILMDGCQAADLVKLNEEELETVCQLTEVSDPGALRTRFDLQAVILTRGPKGTAALAADGWIEGSEIQYPRMDGADTVGAGDACSAGLLSALVSGKNLAQALELANHMGAYVAGQIGATPTLPESLQGWLA